MAGVKLTSVLAASMLACGESSPNLMLVYLDQWRFDWAGFDDADLRLPNLAGIAAKGTRFTHAFTPTPLCAPARGALASGKEYDESPVPDNGIDYDTSIPTYYHLLQKAGYHTMAAGKDHLTMVTGVGVNGSIHAKACGFDAWERMPDKYEAFTKEAPAYGKPYDQWTVQLASEQYTTLSACYGDHGMGDCCDQIQGVESGAFCPRTQPAGDEDVVYPDDWTEASAEALLDQKPQGKPWFMQVGFPGPHPPFILTEAMNKSVQGRTYPSPQGDENSFGDEFYQVMRRQYAAEIENIDTLIGKLVAKLEASGELNNTVIAVSSDHGEMLGDYNKYAKSMPWDGSARVPLLFMGPGIKKGAVLTQPATSLDIVGTFLELAGAEKDANMTTESMLPLLSGTSRSGGRSYVSSGLGSSSSNLVGSEYGNEDYHTNVDFPPGGGGVNWRMVVKQMNDTSTLKLICCPTGCDSINGNSTLFPKSSSAQVGLFEVAGARMEVDLLSQGVGKTEAVELVALLPSTYKDKCGALVSDEVHEVVI